MGKHAGQQQRSVATALHNHHGRHDARHVTTASSATGPQLAGGRRLVPAVEQMPKVLANVRQRRTNAPLATSSAFVARLRRPAKGFSLMASGAFALMTVVGPYSVTAAPAYADNTHSVQAPAPDGTTTVASDQGNDQTASAPDESSEAAGDGDTSTLNRSAASAQPSSSSDTINVAATATQDVTSSNGASGADASDGYDRDGASAKAPAPAPTGDDPEPSTGSPKAYAAAEIAKRGWSSDNYGCLVKLWNRESHWSTSASNPSGAYGIPQALPGSKMSSAGPNWRTNAHTQIDWGLGYIAGRYGTPCKAWAHSQSTGWY